MFTVSPNPFNPMQADLLSYLLSKYLEAPASLEMAQAAQSLVASFKKILEGNPIAMLDFTGGRCTLQDGTTLDLQPAQNVSAMQDSGCVRVMGYDIEKEMPTSQPYIQVSGSVPRTAK